MTYNVFNGTLNPTHSLTHPPLFSLLPVLTALGVLRMLPVWQRLGDAYGVFGLGWYSVSGYV